VLGAQIGDNAVEPVVEGVVCDFSECICCRTKPRRFCIYPAMPERILCAKEGVSAESVMNATFLCFPGWNGCSTFIVSDILPDTHGATQVPCIFLKRFLELYQISQEIAVE
jgi:hypothetical protein